MAELRIGRGWTESELEARLDRARQSKRNFTEPVEGMSVQKGWHEYYSESVVGHESPGAAVEGGSFARGCQAITQYTFSDPRIVIAHFDPDVPLLNRHMLLEARAFRFLHYLGAVIVSAVRSDATEEETVFGFRYETLEGHIEQGAEWFLLKKSHDSGAIRFRIQAAWRPGQFPNWWSRVGFSLVGRYYQKRWHHRAHRALQEVMGDARLSPNSDRPERLVHGGPEIIFKRIEARYV